MIDFSNVEGVLARLIQLVFNAHSAVIIFFVLSGYVLTLSLQRLASLLYGVEFFTFVIRRIYRIFPALICSLLILGFMNSYPSDKLVQNMLLLDTSINGVAWTLKVELAGCLVIFLAFTARLIWWPGLIVMAGVLSAIFFGGFLPPIFAKYLPAFFIGSMIVYVDRKLVVGRLAAYTALTVMLVSDMMLGYKTDASILVQTACAGVLILSIGRSESMVLLNRPFLSFLGRISFSFYLLHLVGMILTRQLCQEFGLPLGQMSMIANAATYAAISIPLTIAISVVTYELVELPMNKVGGATADSFKKFFDRFVWRRPSVTTAAQSIS